MYLNKYNMIIISEGGGRYLVKKGGIYYYYYYACGISSKMFLLGIDKWCVVWRGDVVI